MSSQLDTGDARRIDLPVSGVHGPSVAALQAGDPDGVPVLMVPGFTGSKEDFGPLLTPLAEAGFFVTSIDLPGQYESPGADDPSAYAVDVLGALVADLAWQLGGPLHLLGHSFGGLVSRAAVLARPALFDSLVLMDSGPGRLGGSRADVLQFLAPMLDSDGLAAVYEASEALYQAEAGYVAPPPALQDFFRTRFLAQSVAMLHGMSQALLTEPDRVGELADIGVPVLVLYGADDDAWLPDEQAGMAKRLDASVAIIDGAVHSPAVENTPDTLAALTAFWSASA